MEMCVSFSLYFPFLLIASVLLPVTGLATINIGNKSCICIAGIHGVVCILHLLARDLNSSIWDSYNTHYMYTRAYYESLKKRDWDFFAKLKITEIYKRICTVAYLRKSGITRIKSKRERGAFSTSVLYTCDVRHACVLVCVRACVYRRVTRIWAPDACLESLTREAAIARAANPIGRDNGNNAIGTSAQGIGARRPSRCAWASMTWLALISIAPLIRATRREPERDIETSERVPPLRERSLQLASCSAQVVREIT